MECEIFKFINWFYVFFLPLSFFLSTFFPHPECAICAGGQFNKRRIECWWSNSRTFKYSNNTTGGNWTCWWNKVCICSLTRLIILFTRIINNHFNRFNHSRCCCFFKRKKKKSSRQKWLDAVQCSPEREAVTLLRATSHSNSRDSVLNPSQDYIQATSQHTIRYPSTSLLTSTPTNNTPTLPL